MAGVQASHTNAHTPARRNTGKFSNNLNAQRRRVIASAELCIHQVCSKRGGASASPRPGSGEGTLPSPFVFGKGFCGLYDARMATVPIDVLEPNESDDDGFLTLVRSAVRHVVEQHLPTNLYLVRIDNWFGERWLGFGGKLVGAVGVHPTELTIPPFNPNRVRAECAFVRTDDGSYAQVDGVERLHLDISSEANLRRKIRATTESGVFAWFSGNSIANGRGSLLVYTSAKEDAVGWYAGFERKDGWRIESQKGISREALLTLVAAHR